MLSQVVSITSKSYLPTTVFSILYQPNMEKIPMFIPGNLASNPHSARHTQSKFSVFFNVPRSCWIFSCKSVMAYNNCSGRGGHPGT